MPTRAFCITALIFVWLLPATAGAKDLCFKDSIGARSGWRSGRP
jgi:hypothetical protein